MIYTILEISISTAAVIAFMLALSSLIDRHIFPRGRYVLWLILAVRLVIPLNVTLPSPVVKIAPQERTVVLRTEGGSPVKIVTEQERIEGGRENPSSADYAPIISLKELITLVWGLGAAAVLFYHLASYWLFRLRIRGKTVLLGEYKGLKVYSCELLEGPMLIGFLRPNILLPNVDYSAEEKEMILSHEYVHYRRLDLWYKLLLAAANALHWFNPFVYAMVRRANRDIEYSCDEAVTRGKSMEFKRLYAMTILKAVRVEER